jgi:hypothetical protein
VAGLNASRQVVCTHRRQDPELLWRHVAQICSIEFHLTQRSTRFVIRGSLDASLFIGRWTAWTQRAPRLRESGALATTAGRHGPRSLLFDRDTLTFDI